MWRGAVVALAAIAATGCDRLADPVSMSIFFDTRWAGRVTSVSSHLPLSGAEAVRQLAEFGYQPDADLAKVADRRAVEEGGHTVLDTYYVPDVVRGSNVQQRLYLTKSFHGQQGGSEGFGIILDIDEKGDVVTAIGFKAFFLY